jgi:Fe-S cluster assembly protein SufD
MHSLAEQWNTELAERGQAEASVPGWLRELRRSGAAAFEQYGLPNRKVEDWKYTSLKLLEARRQNLVDPDLDIDGPCDTTWARPLIDAIPRILLVNGDPGCDLPLEEGPEVLTLDQAQGHPDHGPWVRGMLASLDLEGPANSFSALNTSMLGPGLVIHVPAGCDGGDLLLQWGFIEYMHAMLHSSRVLVRLEKGASLRLIEQFESGDETACALNLVVQADIGEDATLRQYQVQQEAEETVLILRNECDVHGEGQYEFAGFDWGGGLVRHDVCSRLLDAGASARVSGAFVLDNRQHVDYHVLVDHAGGKTSSEQFFRGVLGGRSRGVFNGKARIRQGADESSVRQSNANLLLSPMAEIDTKPELEIYADEVEASHGATVGQLDEDAVFYLRSRGLNEEQARAMLTSAFCKAVLDRNPDLPASLGTVIESRMDSALRELVGSRTGPEGLPG